MQTEKETWGEYSKLVLKELERLNQNQETLRRDIDLRLTQINDKLSKVEPIGQTVDEHKKWIERVNDIWSPQQMKEAKDELYKQKNRWAQVTGVIVAIQIIVGLLMKFFNI